MPQKNSAPPAVQVWVSLSPGSPGCLIRSRDSQRATSNDGFGTLSIHCQSIASDDMNCTELPYTSEVAPKRKTGTIRTVLTQHVRNRPRPFVYLETILTRLDNDWTMVWTS